MTRVLERGNIYFLFRPRVGEERPDGLDDVQRLFVVLIPRDEHVYRRLVIGRKRMPDTGAHERHWAFVDKVADRPEPLQEDLEAQRYATKARGERVQPAGRPAGEGVYAIVEHLVESAPHVHLAYALEVPDEPGAVQRELGIDREASYVVAVLNPLPRTGTTDYPAHLQARFADRRFAPLDPELLDHEGAELVLIGAREHPQEELGIELHAERAWNVDIFRELHLDRETHPAQPLFEGAWD
ncbi:MAG: hypothetical protein HYV09_20610 [Deltaproteobacteria bacterium]|nr:hypothetical protein [Deltaproteobacteria bacterium]